MRRPGCVFKLRAYFVIMVWELVIPRSGMVYPFVIFVFVCFVYFVVE